MNRTAAAASATPTICHIAHPPPFHLRDTHYSPLPLPPSRGELRLLPQALHFARRSYSPDRGESRLPHQPFRLWSQGVPVPRVSPAFHLLASYSLVFESPNITARAFESADAASLYGTPVSPSDFRGFAEAAKGQQFISALPHSNHSAFLILRTFLFLAHPFSRLAPHQVVRSIIAGISILMNDERPHTDIGHERSCHHIRHLHLIESAFLAEVDISPVAEQRDFILLSIRVYGVDFSLVGDEVSSLESFDFPDLLGFLVLKNCIHNFPIVLYKFPIVSYRFISYYSRFDYKVHNFLPINPNFSAIFCKNSIFS